MRTQQPSRQAARQQPTDSPKAVRLHVTPLTAILLPRLLGQALSLAQDVSYHRLPTFPNRHYGFVTLPAGAADMVRKKVHGTLLKGEKVRVEDARTDERLDNAVRERGEEEEAAREENGTTAAVQPQRSLRKRKREEGVISAAVELPDERKVRRGWTEPKRESEARKIKEKREKKKDGKVKVKASAFTDQSECLFQTTVPDEGKKRSNDRKKTKKGKGTMVVHEFENNTKHPSYLRQVSTNKKKTQEFDEEKGWVDEDGNVVEKPAEAVKKVKEKKVIEKEEDPSQSEEQSSVKDDEDDETSTSGSSGTSEEEQEGGSVLEEEKLSPSPIATEEDPIPSNGPSVSVTEPSPVTPHPLETLFKKPKPPASDPSTKSTLEINTSFTFFNNDDVEDEAGPVPIKTSLETPGIPALRRRGLPNLSIPVTPYNHRDMQWRSQRSAAPTPDTAAPGKGGFGDPFGLLANIRQGREQDIEEEEEGGENENDEDEVMQGIEREELGSTSPIKAEPAPDDKESDFSKSFWENRGAKTRTWKKTKRDAAKQQRTRENRKRRV